ncbi:MAG: helix-turn-helix domain-containing protein [Candidatus Diapherotrites archaeon]
MVGVEESDISVIKRTFSRFISRFGENHAKIYRCLLSKEPKTGGQIMKEIGITNEPLFYTALKDLVENGLVAKNHTHPALYFAEDPITKYKRLAAREMQEIRSSAALFSRIIRQAGSGSGGIILSPRDGRVFFNNRALVKEQEILEAKQETDRVFRVLLDRAHERTLKPWMVHR